MLDVTAAHARLRASGLRLTPQRRAVIEALAGNTAHPTAESVAESLSERMPGVSLSTVYKVLHELADLGLVRRVDSAGAMRFDPDTREHLHTVCRDCGELVDTPLPVEVRDAIAAAASDHGIAAESVEIVVHGVCQKCSMTLHPVN